MGFLLKFFIRSMSAKNTAKQAMSLFTAVIKKLEKSNLDASKVTAANEAKIIKLENEKEEMEQLIVQNAVVITNIKKLGIR